MQEVRKDIKWYEWKYFVSNLGNLKSRHQPLKTETNRDGRHRVKFYWSWGRYDRKTYQLHRLVYCTFNNYPLEYDWINLVCHKDNDIENNKLENLYLWTQKENMQQCLRDWRLVTPNDIGKWWFAPKLNYEKATKIRKLIEGWVSKKYIAKLFWVNINAIYAISTWRRYPVSRKKSGELRETP